MPEETDLDRFVALYRTFGIEPIVNTRTDGSKVIYLCRSDLAHGKTTISNKFGGNMEASTEINFSRSGRFMAQYFLS